MPELLYYLKLAVEKKATDIFFVAGAPVSIKLDGDICAAGAEKCTAPACEEYVASIYALADRDKAAFDASGDDDFSFSVSGLSRFRVNTYRQRGSVAAVIRVVSLRIPDYRTMSIPEDVMKFADEKHGMIVISGTAGSGKTTTQACIIDRINHTRCAHIITLEDPVEYLHRDDKCIISQREIAIDTRDYLSALRSALRQAPNVILLGEMRDFETMRTAMTAAETGHMLLTTLHTRGAVNTIDRIIDSFPAAQQSQIRVQLSMALTAVISQQLIPGMDGALVPAYEILRVNGAIRNMIRDNKTHQIDNVIQTSAAEGMLSMDASIQALHAAGRISAENAALFAMNPELMQRRLK